MTVIAAPSANMVGSTLAASYTRGTDTTVVLADGSLFPSPTPEGHVIWIRDTERLSATTKWCLIIYTSRATNTLTMGGGATDYALGKNVSVGDEAYEFPIGCFVDLVSSADEIAELFYESSAEVTLAVDNIPIPTATFLFLPFDTEVTDVQGEFDSVHIVGTADGTTSGHLIDSGEDFAAQGILVGARVLNTTDKTVAYVTNVADYDLTLSADIMVSGETYRVYNARFTAAKAGKYLVILIAEIDDLADNKYMQVGGYKNRTVAVGKMETRASNTDTGVACWTGLVTLMATDYLEFYAYHNVGTLEYVRNPSTRITILKVA